MLKPIIITLTTIPSRLREVYPDDIRSCLDSLLNQSYTGEYEIHLNIPYNQKSTGEEYIIPEFLTLLTINNPKLKIFRTNDYGSGTKLYPTLKRIEDPESLIIVVDDDLVYHEDLIVEQIENQIRFPECIVGYDGLRSKDNIFGDVRDYYFTSNYRDSRVDILQHYKSVSYKRRYFEIDFMDFVEENYSWDDDLLSAAYFSFKKRDRIATFHKEDIKFPTLEEWQEMGGVTTFPILRHTQHESLEGCNLMRHNKVEGNHDNLYKYIDRGYDKNL